MRQKMQNEQKVAKMDQEMQNAHKVLKNTRKGDLLAVLGGVMGKGVLILLTSDRVASR